jgi:hypothetical protein
VGAVLLSWAPPSSPGTSAIGGYRIYYAPTGGTWTAFDVGPTTRSRLISGLRNGTTYWFRIAAYNSTHWSAMTSSVSAKPVPAPGRVPTPRLIQGNRILKLTWSPPPSNGATINRYAVQMYSGGRWATVTTLAASTRSYTARNLVNGREYLFRVLAGSAAGVGTASNPVRGTPGVVTLVSGFTAFDLNNDSLYDAYTLDRWGDGRYDVIFYDANANGIAEMIMFDFNNDGWFETIVYDRNENGKLDVVVFDHSRDAVRGFQAEGYIVDNNENGVSDFAEGSRPGPTSSISSVGSFNDPNLYATSAKYIDVLAGPNLNTEWFKDNDYDNDGYVDLYDRKPYDRFRA